MTWLSLMMKLSSILQHSRFMEMAVNLVYHYPWTTMIVLSVLNEKKTNEDRRASRKKWKKIGLISGKVNEVEKINEDDKIT